MPSIRLKIAVFAPIPNASVSIATAANPGDFASIRNPYRMSCSRLFMAHPPVALRGLCGHPTLPALAQEGNLLRQARSCCAPGLAPDYLTALLFRGPGPA